jgi:hypothetical protein
MLSQRISRSIPSLVLSSLIVSCGSDDPTPDGAEVGRVGGAEPSQVESAGGAVLDVPAWALTAEAEVRIEAQPTALLPPLPAGLSLLGGASAFLPHGLTFDVPATITLPAPAGATRVLRLDDELDTTWQELAGVTFSDGSATFSTPGFSIYAVAGPDGTASARGIVNPPEVVGSRVPAGATADAAQGLLYWVTFLSGRDLSLLLRARIGREGATEPVYETQGDLALAAVGPEAVYFYDSALGSIARLTHDLGGLDATWGSLGPEEGPISPGFASAEHVYLNGSSRIALSGGSVEPSPFVYLVSERCALSPDRASAACTSGILNLIDDTAHDPTDEFGYQLSGGVHAADGEAFYFTPQFFSGPVYRLPFGSTQPQRIAESAEVLSAAARDGRLYLGLADRIVTLDGTTGELLHEYELNNPQFEPNTPMYAWGDDLYYGVSGGEIRRLPLSELGARTP